MTPEETPEGPGPDPDVPEAPQVTLDPFSRLLDFVDAVDTHRFDTASDRSDIEPIEPLDSGADRLVDFDALDALTRWAGLFRAPREMAKEDYPQDLADALDEREPQFILRNLERVERFADPADPLEYEYATIGMGNIDAAMAEVRDNRHQPPELLDEISPTAFARHLDGMRHLYDVVQWERHFSAEIKRDHTGPIWSYDPDAAEAKEKEERARDSESDDDGAED